MGEAAAATSCQKGVHDDGRGTHAHIFGPQICFPFKELTAAAAATSQISSLSGRRTSKGNHGGRKERREEERWTNMKMQTNGRLLGRAWRPNNGTGKIRCAVKYLGKHLKVAASSISLPQDLKIFQNKVEILPDMPSLMTENKNTVPHL